jgi:hypothetical protein
MTFTLPGYKPLIEGQVYSKPTSFQEGLPTGTHDVLVLDRYQEGLYFPFVARLREAARQASTITKSSLRNHEGLYVANTLEEALTGLFAPEVNLQLAEGTNSILEKGLTTTLSHLAHTESDRGRLEIKKCLVRNSSHKRLTSYHPEKRHVAFNELVYGEDQTSLDPQWGVTFELINGALPRVNARSWIRRIEQGNWIYTVNDDMASTIGPIYEAFTDAAEVDKISVKRERDSSHPQQEMSIYNEFIQKMKERGFFKDWPEMHFQVRYKS